MSPIIEQLALEIRALYQDDPAGAPLLIEKYLDKQLGGFNYDLKIQTVTLLMEGFFPSCEVENSLKKPLQEEYLLRFCSLVLGKNLSADEVSSVETLERLSKSLNILFDSLNQLVHSIRKSLSLENKGDETIRHVLGSSLDHEESSASLEQYLAEIKSAFFISHQAFQAAWEKMMARILLEFDHKNAPPAGGSIFLLPGMRKVQAFDRYQQVYDNVRQWHDSGRSMEDFLREFERECQKRTQQTRR